MTARDNLTTSNPIPTDLLIVKEFVYDKCGYDLTDLKTEIESAEYAACTFRLNGMAIKYRVSKITPTKTGQFVAIWKRNHKGVTEPFDFSDDIDFLIITTRSGDNFGQFIFPKSVLLNKGIMSGSNKEGKRGIRVYPPWDKTTNKQAEKTQQWQTEYFLKIPNDSSIDLIRAKKLFNSPTNDQQKPVVVSDDNIRLIIKP